MMVNDKHIESLIVVNTLNTYLQEVVSINIPSLAYSVMYISLYLQCLGTMFAKIHTEDKFIILITCKYIKSKYNYFRFQIVMYYLESITCVH